MVVQPSVRRVPPQNSYKRERAIHIYIYIYIYCKGLAACAADPVEVTCAPTIRMVSGYAVFLRLGSNMNPKLIKNYTKIEPNWAKMGHLDSKLEVLGLSWWSWALSWGSWDHLGSKLGGPGAILAPSWRVLGPSWLPKPLPNPKKT